MYFLASSAGTITTAAAPSETGEQSKSVKGSATIVELITLSTLISNGNCAFGLFLAFLWFTTEN